MTLFHTEVQEVFYRTYAVEADDANEARANAVDGTVDSAVGFHLVSNLVTNVHPVDDKCVARGCYKEDEEE